MQASAGSGGMWFQDERLTATDVDIVVYRSFIEFHPHVDVPDIARGQQARQGRAMAELRAGCSSLSKQDQDLMGHDVP